MDTSAGARRLLGEILGHVPGAAVDRFGVGSQAPTARKIADPAEAVEDVIARLDEAPTTRRANGYLARRTGRDPQTARRMCCSALLQQLDTRLHLLPVLSDHVCPGCGATWRVEYQRREERRHG